MKSGNLHLGASAPVFIAIFAGAVTTLGSPYSTLLAGLLSFTALATMRRVERISIREGLTENQRIVLVSSGTLYELVLILAAVSLPIVPKYAAALALASIAFAEILRLELRQKLKTPETHEIGREGRVAVVGLSLVGHFFNQYLLFYGIIFIFLLSIYDALRFIHRLRS